MPPTEQATSLKLRDVTARKPPPELALVAPPIEVKQPDRDPVLHVVGDKFVSFARENPGVMTISAVERLLEDGLPQTRLGLIVGQGVSLERLRRLEKLVAECPARERVQIREASVQDRAPGKYTHKHLDRNTIISTPVKRDSADIYDARLLLDDDCAEMSDHVTGHHLQGIVFYEAARQMFLAVTERYWLERSSRPYYFVINEFNTTYHTFGFPLPTDISLQVVDERGDSRNTGAIFLDVKIEFFQVGVPITECFVKYAAFDKVLLSAREGLLSRLALVKLSPELFQP
jgi:hypothetical protein